MGWLDDYFSSSTSDVRAVSNATPPGPWNVTKIQTARVNESKNNMTRVGNRTETTSSFAPPPQAPDGRQPKGVYGLSDYLPAMVRDLIEVDHSRDDLLLGDDFRST